MTTPTIYSHRCYETVAQLYTVALKHKILIMISKLVEIGLTLLFSKLN